MSGLSEAMTTRVVSLFEEAGLAPELAREAAGRMPAPTAEAFESAGLQALAEQARRRGASAYSTVRVAAIAARIPAGGLVEESARPATSPWGRPIEGVREAMAGRTTSEMERLFVEVGLSESRARVAAEGLREGRFGSFEDAAVTSTMFDAGARVRLNRHKLAEVAAAVGSAGKVDGQ